MADYTQYHALGHGEVIDPNDPNKTTAPVPQQFSPPVAPNPHQPQYGAPQYQGGQPAPMSSPPMAGQMYGMPSAQSNAQMPPAAPDASLASQLGDMSLGQNTIRKKKKDRHAHHNIEATGSSQAFNGMQPGANAADQFINNPGNVPAFGGQFGSNPVTPQLNQAQFGGPANSFQSPDGPIDPAGPKAGYTSSVPASQVRSEDLPSVPVARDSIQQYYLKNVYPTFERHVPPPASISFVAFDQGNASPKFARLTLNNIPATADGLTATGLPLGLLLQPLAPLQSGEAEIPVLDFGPTGPPRCRRCRAYINPFMMFRSGGNRFVCNLCTHPNETPPEYFCATSPQGVRVDRDQRPELHRGTVEFIVPKEYWTREPVGLRWLFVIDVTQESYNKGFLEAFCDGILAALYGGVDAEKDENGEVKRRLPEGAKVGFVTYDKDIHFYNISVSIACATCITDMLTVDYSHRWISRI